MQLTFDPLNPQEADVVRCLLNTAAGAPLLSPEAVAALRAAEVPAAAIAAETPAQPAAATVPAPAKSHKKKAAPAVEAQPAAPAPPAPAQPEVLSVGDLLAQTQAAEVAVGAMVAPAAPAVVSTPQADGSTVRVSVPPPVGVPAGAKAPTVEDVRAAYRDLFAVVGEEPGKAELRTVLAKAGAATVSDLKPEGYAAVIRRLNAAAIVAKSKAAPAAAAAPVKDPLL